MNNEYFKPCTKCGRPQTYCKGTCCKQPKGCECPEYGPKVCGAIRPGQPECPYQAVIPSLTVESVSNLKDLADCFVHVADINTTFYIDDKHRIVTTWAGLVSVDDYDFEANPLNLRGQIAYDAKNNKAAIYDKQGANYIFQISDIDNNYLLLENKPQINGVTLEGNKSLNELDIPAIEEVALTFDTVADMKQATNLIDGSYAQTLGYHAKNDGGKALYKIRTVTNADTEDDAFIIALSDQTLVAELIVPADLPVEVTGAYGDNTHDDIIAIQKAIDSNVKHIVLSKTYKISTPIIVPSQKLIDGGGEIHSSTIGIKLDGVRYTTVRDLRIFAGTNGVLITSDTSYSAYINIEGIYCNGYISEQSQVGEKGIYINTTSNYINECYYNRCVIYNYQYGIYATAESNDPQMQRHIFKEISPEGATVGGVYVKNGERFTFENCRCLEGNSSKWFTEGTCSAFNIISGEAWFASGNDNFSTGTNGVIIGALRNANIALNAPNRSGYIVNGKVIADKENINPYFKNITSAGLTINYGDELVTQFKMGTSSNVALNLPADCYGGICKVNEFYISTYASAGTLTINIGDYFSYDLASPTNGRKYYRFSYTTLIHGAEKSWFVEDVTPINI